MKTVNGKVALVTGGSSGIGESTVRQLVDAGCIVYAAARRVEKMKPLEEIGARILSMDVTVDDSMVSGVEQIAGEAGGVDILVNNAGYGSYGAVEDVPIDEARRQFEVNIFGVARLTQLVLPGMREKRYGKIVNVSSMGGKIYTPFGAWYHATKHALEGWSDCLRIETKPYGIDVIVIEPGGIATPWGAISAENLQKTSGTGAYADRATATAHGMAERYESDSLSSPTVIGEVIRKAVAARRPKTRYAAGYMAKPSLFLRSVLSDRMFDRLINSMM